VSATVRIPIADASGCGHARRAAVTMAKEIGFDEARAGEVAIVATEACTNILKHAGSGEVLLGFAENAPECGIAFELLALDRGPGMSSVDRCLEDGYSTAGSAGEGLGAIQRLSAESDFFSVPGAGTAVLARWSSQKAATGGPSRPRIGAVNISKRGQDVCGDSWGIELEDGFWTVLVADGLGHGFEAGEASREAVRTLRTNRDAGPKTLIELSHRALRSLRGAAVAVARVDHAHGTLTFSGLGNVAAQIYDGSRHSQHLVSVNGTAGQIAPRVREFTYPWPAGGMLVMHSDGLATSTSLDGYRGLAMRDPSLIAGVLYRDFSRGHDDATVVVAKAV